MEDTLVFRGGNAAADRLLGIDGKRTVRDIIAYLDNIQSEPNPGGLGIGRIGGSAVEAIARQPEAAGTLSRTLFVGLAMIETMAIYCLVIALLLLYANPFTG